MEQRRNESVWLLWDKKWQELEMNPRLLTSETAFMLTNESQLWVSTICDVLLLDLFVD